MKTQSIKSGDIVKHNSRLCEVIGYTTGKCVFLHVLKNEDKDRCPHCDKPIETEINEVENCPNWIERVEPVETILPI